MNRYIGKPIKTARATAVVATLLLLAATLNSCTKELADGEQPSPAGENLEIQITFPKSEHPQVAKSNVSAKVRALGSEPDDAGLTFWTSDIATRATDPGTEQERRIDRMALLFFNEEGAKLVDVLTVDLSSANLSQPLWKSKNTLIVRPIIDKTTPKKIYAVANWSTTDFDKGTYTEAMLKKELSTAATIESLATPFLMSGSNSVNFSTSNYKVTVGLERQVAKLKIDLTVDPQADLSNIEWLVDRARIAVGNVPDKSYVVGRTPAEIPTGHTLLTSGFVPMTVTSDAKLNHSAYVNENPVMGTDAANTEKTTYVVIQLPYRNKDTKVEEYGNYYKVYVNNAGEVNPYQVLRNTIYNLNLKVVGLGLPFTDLVADTNIDEVLTVTTWEENDIEIDAKPKYINVSRNRIEFQSIDTEHKVTVSTDISDWKLVGADGTTIFSYAESETDPFTDGNLTYTINGTASVATITISRALNAYFSWQKTKLIARNIEVPLSVADDNGVIPNSELVTSFQITGDGGGYYFGWPSGALPNHGLQVAKIGNRLPSELPLSDDQETMWSSEYTLVYDPDFNFGNGKLCNYGKMMTEKVLKLDASKYPAHNICAALGEGWYLPSKGELALIWFRRESLGPSYTFKDKIFWTSSESYNENAHYMNIIGCASYHEKKVIAHNIRCVKNI